MNKIETKETDKAFYCSSLPCNPLPFINRLQELCSENKNNITSMQAKANLYILLTQCFGQLFSIDDMDLFTELKKEFIKE